MTFDQIIALVQSGGLLGVVLLAGFGGYKGIWYFGNQVRQREAEALERFVKLEADRDEWKEMALGAIRAGQTIADAKEKP